MTEDRRARFTATGALAAALLSLGLSSWAIGCSERKQDPDHELVRAVPAVQQVAAEAKPAALSKTEPSVTPAGTVATAPLPSTTVKKRAPASTATLGGELSVRRVVVSHAIENREPVASAELELGDRPVIAFVELANPGAEEQRIVVTFERDGKSVGHVQLKVPGESRRWRTWGQTRRIREAGQWTAVVRTEDGKELARTTFDVVN